jgi:uncharacterized protein with HEPN domain
MPLRRWKLRVRDILNAIAAIRQYIKGLDYDAFISDRKTVDAVIRNLITIGEAAVYMPDDVTAAHPEVPWRDMRNIVIHEYFGISDKIIWETIQKDLPPLSNQLLNLLETD